MASIKLKFKPSAAEGGSGRLFFQIIHHRQVRRINLDIHIMDYEWDADRQTVKIAEDARLLQNARLSRIAEILSGRHARLRSIVSAFDSSGIPYTAQDVVAAYSAADAGGGVVSFIRRLAGDMRDIGRRPAVKRLETLANSILRYTGGKDVAWCDVTPTFVLGYEGFLMQRGLCRNSTSFYMRNLRMVVNRAVEQNYNVPTRPFRHVYTGVDRTVKRAVGLDTICRIRDLDLAGHPSLDFARNVFMFAFYTRGMSFVDIAYLRKRDVRNGVITYSRRKTRQQIQVRIEPETKRIIDSFGRNESPYLLPVIGHGAGDAERQYENAYYRVNRNIQKVGRMLGLDIKLTLYVARHAWASIAHANNVELSTISKAMGHDSERTTVIYLQSLDMRSVDKANSDIIGMMAPRNNI